MLNVAVVGMGWWGRQIVGSLVGSDLIRVTHGVDVEPAGARAFADSHGLRLGSNYQAVLEDLSVDGVILATPHGLHASQVLAAAAHKKQVFCEKPLALSVADAQRMIDACEEAGVRLGIGHERRFEPALEALKRELDDGAFGTLIHLDCNWSHNIMTKVPASGWRKDPAQAPLGTLTALGVHITDYFQSIAGPVATVSVETAHRSQLFPSDDVVVVRLRFASGATGTLCNIATTPFYSRVTAYGDKGWGEARENSNVDIPEPATLTTRGLDEQLTIKSFKPRNTVRLNLEQWAGAALQRSDYRFTAAEMLHNIAILEAIIRSAHSGATIAVG